MFWGLRWIERGRLIECAGGKVGEAIGAGVEDEKRRKIDDENDHSPYQEEQNYNHHHPSDSHYSLHYSPLHHLHQHVHDHVVP